MISQRESVRTFARKSAPLVTFSRRLSHPTSISEFPPECESPPQSSPSFANEDGTTDGKADGTKKDTDTALRFSFLKNLRAPKIFDASLRESRPRSLCLAADDRVLLTEFSEESERANGVNSRKAGRLRRAEEAPPRRGLLPRPQDPIVRF